MKPIKALALSIAIAAMYAGTAAAEEVLPTPDMSGALQVVIDGKMNETLRNDLDSLQLRAPVMVSNTSHVQTTRDGADETACVCGRTTGRTSLVPSL